MSDQPFPCVDCITLSICKAKYAYYVSRHPTDIKMASSLMLQYAMDKCATMATYLQTNMYIRLNLFGKFYDGGLIITNWREDG